MKTIAMVLSPAVVDSQVLIDGHDITSCVRGVEIQAHVGEPLHITLHLIGRVELMADVDVNTVTYAHPKTGGGIPAPDPAGE